MRLLNWNLGSTRAGSCALMGFISHGARPFCNLYVPAENPGAHVKATHARSQYGLVVNYKRSGIPGFAVGRSAVPTTRKSRGADAVVTVDLSPIA